MIITAWMRSIYQVGTVLASVVFDGYDDGIDRRRWEVAVIGVGLLG